ncbi:MAG: head GIN domain-containing protein [Saprospiraceae bacterium]
MKNTLLILLLLTATLSWSQREKIKGSGSTVNRTLEVASFTAVECNLYADVEITQGPNQKVTIEGQENIIDKISTEVKENRWRIKLPKNTWGDYDKVKIKITVPQLHGLGMAGSGSMKTTNTITSDDFQIGLSGSGKMDVSVNAENVDCGISGSGNIHLTGKTNELSLGTSGSGDVMAKDMVAGKVKIGISGSGDCEVNVSESLEAGISGSGSVRYKGRPKVKSSISGSGSLNSID